MTPTMTLDQIEEATDDLPLLGYTVFWALRGVRVDHSDLQTLLGAAGFVGAEPDLPTPRIALRRAIVDWIGERAAAGQGPDLADSGEESGNAPTKQRALLRVINQKQSHWLAFALVAEDVNFARLGLHHGTTLRIILK